MSIPRVLLAAMVFSAFALASAGPSPADADEGPVTAWIYDIHVVRVDTTTPDVVEKAPDWLKEGSTTVDLPWSEFLADLKKRGATTVLLDQRVTGLAGYEVLARQIQDRQIEQFSRRDRNNETWQSSTVTMGCSAKLLTQETLRYDVEVKWVSPRQEGDLRPLLGTTAWAGTHAPLHGTTLALRFAQQVTWEKRETRGVEIYAFVTGRMAAP